MANQIQLAVQQRIRDWIGESATDSDILRGADLYCQAGVPRRHTMRDSISSESAWMVELKKLVARSGQGYLACLIGPRGTGKTQLAQGAIAHCTAFGYSAKYCRAMDLFVHIQSCFGDKATNSQMKVLDQYRTPQLLVIDELQERKSSEWEKYTLTSIVDQRYGDETDTIIIANLTAGQLKEALGASIVDRMRETGGIIECDWTSFRKRKDESDET